MSIVRIQARRQRTSTELNTLQPKWNQKMTYYGVPLDELLYKSVMLVEELSPIVYTRLYVRRTNMLMKLF